MTQQEFDRRFERVLKAGGILLFSGISLMIFVGLPVALLADDFRAYFVAVGMAIAGGFISVCAFWHDILCNPRWKRP